MGLCCRIRWKAPDGVQIPKTLPPADPNEMRRWLFFSKMAPLTVLAAFEIYPIGGGLQVFVFGSCDASEKQEMDLGSGMACVMPINILSTCMCASKKNNLARQNLFLPTSGDLD